MIVRRPPSTLSLLFAVRGSIIVQVWARLLLVILFATLVVAAYRLGRWPLPAVSLPAFSLIGLVLSIFLAFRNNACYDRWWEARKQWGHLIGQARAFARELPALLPQDAPRWRRQLKRAIAFTACLNARLRALDEIAASRPWLDQDDIACLTASNNRPSALLRLITGELAEALRRGEIGEISFRLLADRVEEMNAVRTACERILLTPTPFAYSLLLHRTSWIFCLLSPFGLVGSCGMITPLITGVLAYAFFGLDALGDELEEPFGLLPNDLPLDAMVRVIEIDLLEACGETDLPAPLGPVDFQLR